MNVYGNSLGPYYEAPEVQAVLRRAVATMTGGPGAHVSLKAAAQDTLDVLYTCMMFGFRDWKPTGGADMMWSPEELRADTVGAPGGNP